MYKVVGTPNENGGSFVIKKMGCPKEPEFRVTGRKIRKVEQEKI